jgi:hypothetical protein
MAAASIAAFLSTLQNGDEVAMLFDEVEIFGAHAAIENGRRQRTRSGPELDDPRAGLDVHRHEFREPATAGRDRCDVEWIAQPAPKATKCHDVEVRPDRAVALLTNRIPRRYATLFMGWFSRIENPLVRWISFRVWQTFGGDLRLDEPERTDFTSIHDCFTRRLKAGASSIPTRVWS